MGEAEKKPGALMAAEIAQSPGVFARAVCADHTGKVALGEVRAVYTIARGSSDAAANILSYEAMRELGVPVTSLPPSTFSVYGGVRMDGTLAVVISQSGASPDLVSCARGIRERGGRVVAIANKAGSAVEAAADATMPIGAGPELAVPATKSVVGSIAAGMSLIAAVKPGYRIACVAAAQEMTALSGRALPDAVRLRAALLRARHVYVIGRGAGFGAAQELALKIKETCAIHAEAYSASEVLHGPLQLATNPLCALILDTDEAASGQSIDKAEARFRGIGVDVHRVRAADAGAGPSVPAAAAAMLLFLLYPVILAASLALGHDPDRPETLSKVTETT